ncbi:MAG: helix-turn-helix domain-containing protein [Clostridia bacterium]|nr:helix-turn-helix domain-containing protein [Clostridia bacterium]
MKRLKELRQKQGISQKDFAALIGIPANTYNQWENGKRQPDTETMLKLAEYFNVSVDYLLGRDDKTVSAPRRKGIRIPVYGEVAAGLPIETIENFDSENPDDWEEISEDMARGGDFFALRIHGDSMEPKISSGDIVIVRLQPDVENGETAIVKVNGDTATCKKIKKTPQGLMLISTNPDYEPMFYSKQEVAELPVIIIGKVVELRAKF